MGYKDDVNIDKFSLDNEWINQPKLFCQYAEEAVEASFERDKAKEQLDLVRAVLDGEIRNSPSTYGLEKVTESAISNVIIQTQKYKEANSYYLECVKKTKILDVARESFDHKKKSLEKLTDLFLAGYWSEPRINEEVKTKFTEESTGEAVSKLNENPRLRRRKV
jgi:hypothetical protein